MSELRIRDILGEVAPQPRARWPELLAKRFPSDRALVEQALLWLEANDEQLADDETPPSLGEDGDVRYELAVRLDVGSTASVWRAHDRKLGRDVAIKVFHARGDSDVLHQAMAEARAASDVISDHVVRVLDVHETGAHPYIVMELVGEHDPDRGELSLGRSACAIRPRDVDEAARWVLEVARGVHDAHLRNVFHRDLKPHNVLITPISRHARIADFGLAVGAMGEDDGRAAMALLRKGPTGPVAVAGTPGYMAPEQACGLPLDLDPRSADHRHMLVAIDVWGLGALAYELLAGRPPWRPRAADEESWELAASGARPPPLDRMAIGVRIPRRLKRIVEHAMALAPEERYHSAGQVANELAAFLARRPTSHDRSRAARAALWCRRNPRLTAAGALTLALVGLTLGTRATVSRLRGERFALNREVEAKERELGSLEASIGRTRADLDTTQRYLQAARAKLSDVTNSLTEERNSYETVLANKDKALRDANAATRDLVLQVDAARVSLKVAEEARAKADADMALANRELERVTKERDRARRDRDAVRTERDGMRDERDSALGERDRLQRELDRLQQDLARLTGSTAARRASP